jgi:hypothetical protein
MRPTRVRAIKSCVRLHPLLACEAEKATYEVLGVAIHEVCCEVKSERECSSHDQV